MSHRMRHLWSQTRARLNQLDGEVVWHLGSRKKENKINLKETVIFFLILLKKFCFFSPDYLCISLMCHY